MNKQQLLLCSLLLTTSITQIHAMKNNTFVYNTPYANSLAAGQKDLDDKIYAYINIPNTQKYDALQASFIHLQRVGYLQTGRSIAHQDLKIRKRSQSTPEFYTHIKRLGW